MNTGHGLTVFKDFPFPKKEIEKFLFSKTFGLLEISRFCK